MTTTSLKAAALAGALALCVTAVAGAQDKQTPGPTKPVQPNPQAKPGATMVLNPTQEECRRGWNPTLKWTKLQFDEFCTKQRAAK